ncbi:type III pantothenate kinase [Candidatus Sumerlaeota bacterium]|nr:type III pantothenate kinase [Candidatus Sumerlaeota bacterium]
MTMFLSIDVGNTQIVLGLYESDQLRKTWRLAADAERTGDEYGASIDGLVRRAGFDTATLEGCMISSVIPRLTQSLCAAISAVSPIEPMALTHDLDLGIENRYQRPENVGADRLANAVGGVERYGAPLIVVDFGTATTLDVISADRAYLGGAIMPGLEIGADALFKRTSLLPRVAIEPPSSAIGRSTTDAIASGLVWGTIGAIDGIVERIRAELRAPDCLVVATGGHAAAVAGLSETISKIDPDLTSFGILRIWQRNRKRT